MVDTKDLEMIKEYDRFILFRNKKTGFRECIMKVDLKPERVERKKNDSKYA